MANPRIAIFGASGLIGAAVAGDLARRGFPVLAVARRFDGVSAAQDRIEAPFAEMSAKALRALLAEHAAEIVVNAVGALQEGAETAHVGFPSRLLAALRGPGRPALLVHLSIPAAASGATRFSRSKHRADAAIAASGLAYVILRPGFVVAPAAFGGGALMRALAASRLALPAQERARPLRFVAMSDVAATVAWTAAQWRTGRRDFACDFDLMSASPTNVGDIVDGLRRHFGGPAPWASLPRPLLSLGAGLADAAAALGWRAPIRSTALAELRRGVSGDPAPWIAATGIVPKNLAEALAEAPASVQERWFARTYLLKAAVIVTLSGFYALSGAVALTAGFSAAKAALAARGFAPAVAAATVVATAGLDLAVAAAIALRRTHRAGLRLALALALAYLAGGTILAPELWADPLGPLLKVVPVLALALVALALAPER